METNAEIKRAGEFGGWERGIGKGDRLRGSGLIGSIAFQRGNVER